MEIITIIILGCFILTLFFCDGFPDDNGEGDDNNDYR